MGKEEYSLQEVKLLSAQEKRRAGRLQYPQFARRWAQYTKDPWVLRTIREGIRVSIRPMCPQQREPREHKWSSPSEEEWEWRELALEWKAIERVPNTKIGESGEIIHNLVSEQKKGRLCSNTKDLNQAVPNMPLTMESLKDVRQRFRKDQWLLKIDISKFYWSMGIKASHRKYFRFRMDGALWQWRVLPFGFKNSMQIMARLTTVILMKFSSWGFDALIWVDDIVLLLGENRDQARKDAAKALLLLHNLGFIINQEKTSDDVTQEVEFRGFVWNTKDFLT
jgi:hypothetical protein